MQTLFLPNITKIDLYNFKLGLYHFKVGSFFETQCIFIIFVTGSRSAAVVRNCPVIGGCDWINTQPNSRAFQGILSLAAPLYQLTDISTLYLPHAGLLHVTLNAANVFEIIVNFSVIFTKFFLTAKPKSAQQYHTNIFY